MADGAAAIAFAAHAQHSLVCSLLFQEGAYLHSRTPVTALVITKKRDACRLAATMLSVVENGGNIAAEDKGDFFVRARACLGGGWTRGISDHTLCVHPSELQSLSRRKEIMVLWDQAFI